MKKFISPLAILFCILFSASCYAGILTPVPDDKSLEYLGTIFQIGNLTGSSPPWLHGLFDKFNTIVLSLGVCLLSYIYIVSTINTAQEGTFMGKKYSSAWIILRSILGIALLAPSNTGYSLMQQSVIWVVTNGVGAADNLWEYVVNQIDTDTGNVRIPADKYIDATYSSALTEALLKTAVCAEITGNSGYVINPEHKKPDNSDLLANKEIYSSIINFGNQNNPLDNICGSYKIIGETKLDTTQDLGINLKIEAKNLHDDKAKALVDMYLALVPIAQRIVAETVEPRIDKIHGSKGRLPTNTQLRINGYDKFTPAGYINEANKIYSDILSKRIIPKKKVDIRQTQRSAIARGWVTAGEYYYLLNKSSHLTIWPDAYVPPQAIADTVPSFDIKLPSDVDNLNAESLKTYTEKIPSLKKLQELFDGETKAPKLIKAIQALYDAKQYFATDITYQSKTVNMSRDLNNQNSAAYYSKFSLGQIKNFNLSNEDKQLTVGNYRLKNGQTLGNCIDIYINSWTKDLFSNPNNEDPLLLLAKLGDRIMQEIENSWKTILSDIIKSIKSEADDIPEMSVTVIVTAILVTTWGFAAMLSVYLPAVPYIIFALGVLGWMLLVVEATIAAPILALAFIAPSQDEMGKTMPGIMLLLNILLRPSLMVVGFLISALFLKAALLLVNNGMMAAMYSFRATTASMTGPIIMLFVYINFVVAITNKSFSLIYILPDKILRWIGNSGEDTGQTISQVMGEAKGGFEKGSATFGEFTKGITEAAGSDGTRIAGQMRKNQAGAGIP